MTPMRMRPNETQDQRPPLGARVAAIWRNNRHQSYTSERAAVRWIAWLGDLARVGEWMLTYNHPPIVGHCSSRNSGSLVVASSRKISAASRVTRPRRNQYHRARGGDGPGARLRTTTRNSENRADNPGITPLLRNRYNVSPGDSGVFARRQRIAASKISSCDCCDGSMTATGSWWRDGAAHAANSSRIASAGFEHM